jgi:hypothetical protein
VGGSSAEDHPIVKATKDLFGGDVVRVQARAAPEGENQ